MEVCPVGAGLLLADGRTGVTKLPVAFRNAANATNQAVSNRPPCAVHRRTGLTERRNDSVPYTAIVWSRRLHIRLNHDGD